MEQSSLNLLLNNSFEYNIQRWAFTNGYGGSTGSGSTVTDQQYIGSKSFKIDKTNATDRSDALQWVELTKGKTYTVSGYIRTDGFASTGGANIQVVFGDGTGSWNQRVKTETVSGTKGWERYSVSFTIPTEAKSDKAYVELSVEGAAGTAWFDCLQLEEGNMASRYNLVQNPSFLADGGDGSYYGSDGAVAKGIETGRNGGNSVYMIGNPNAYGRLWQDLNVSGAAGDSYVYGGWAKADSVPVTPEGTNGIKRFTLDVKNGVKIPIENG